MSGEAPSCNSTPAMKLRILLSCLASTVAGACATPQQYVYNCTPNTIAFDGRPIATRTFELRSDTRSANAIYADGSAHPPLRVKSNQVDSFAHSNAWISPANVCRQFASQVVVIDLR